MLDLEAIELIKQLKARYFRFLDTGDIDGLRTVFCDDAHAHFKGGDYDFELNGWAELEAFYKRAFKDESFGMHNGHHPEISVDGNHATGIWYLNDVFVHLKYNVTTMGSALYKDDYRKENGEWRIANTRYTRLWEEMHKRSEDIILKSRPIGKRLPDQQSVN